MPAWLLTLIPYVWRFLKHWGVYILITVVLVGAPYLLYRHGYNKGFKTGYALAVKEHPSYIVGEGGVVHNHYKEDTFKWIGADVKCLWLKLRLGY